MRDCYITFRSVTLAQQGEKLAARAGITCTLQRTPRWMEERGCGYCLQLRRQDISAAAALFRENGILFRKAYARREDGGMEEITV